MSLIRAVIDAPGDVLFVVETGETILIARTYAIREKKQIAENIVYCTISTVGSRHASQAVVN